MGVVSKALHQRKRGRHQAILAKLALTHRQYTPVKVNIGDAQVQDFVHPKAAAVQQAEYFGHDEVTQRRARSRRELINGVEQLLYLGVCRDTW